jgi:hypothetical protein
MEHEDSLPHSQQPATDPCPEPNEFSPHSPKQFLQQRFKYRPTIFVITFLHYLLIFY